MTTQLKPRQKPRRTVDTKPIKFVDEQERAARKQFQDALRQVKTPEDLVRILGIDYWDFLLIGDGSGSTRQHPGGWATACVQREPANTRWYFGSTSYATNISCEMLAYIEPLLDLVANGQAVQKRDVHIITDCEFLVDYWPLPGRWKANKQLWQVLGAMPRIGLMLHFHWIPRDCLNFNQMADNLAGLSRLTAMTLKDEIPKLLAQYFPTEIRQCDDSGSPDDQVTQASATNSPSTTPSPRRKKGSTKKPGTPSPQKSPSDTSS